MDASSRPFWSSNMPSSSASADTAAQLELRWSAFDKALALAGFALDGQLISANAKFQALLHLTPEDLVGLQHAQLCPAGLVQTPEYDAMWQSLCAGHEFSGVVERVRSEEHTSELQSRPHLVCRL